MLSLMTQDMSCVLTWALLKQAMGHGRDRTEQAAPAAVVGASAAPARLLGLIHSGDAAVVGAALAALNNLCGPGLGLASRCADAACLRGCRAGRCRARARWTTCARWGPFTCPRAAAEPYANMLHQGSPHEAAAQGFAYSPVSPCPLPESNMPYEIVSHVPGAGAPASARGCGARRRPRRRRPRAWASSSPGAPCRSAAARARARCARLPL